MFFISIFYFTDEEETTTEATEAADEGKSYLLNLHVTFTLMKCRPLFLKENDY
jgi:hypothetical protein